MRILLSTFGSRGDVEPIAALAVALQALGAEAVVSAPADPEFLRLLDRAGVPVAPAFMPVRAFIERARRSQWPLPRSAAEVMAGQCEAIAAAAHGCDLILATGLFPSTAAAQAVAEKRGVPYVMASFCPVVLPSPRHPPLAYPGHPIPPGVTDNAALWDLNDRAMDALFGEAVNTGRAALGLPTLDHVRDHVRDHVFTRRPWLASDPVLSPWEPTGRINAVQTGAWILPDDRPLPPGLEDFLEAGEPPVYVGFGSMAMTGAQDAAGVAVEAARAHGRRLVLAGGWAGLALAEGVADGFEVGDVNQQALFPRVAAVVHHGGAGTATAAARAGAPQVVVPQVADQPYWAGRVADLGVGIAHEGPAPTVETLSAALGAALRPQTRERAMALSARIRPDGATTAARRLLDLIGGDAAGRDDGALGPEAHGSIPES
ncbi:MAG: glycosyltransferase [Brevundimonas sp.]|uniref:glycosyltransferase n=1 Tax=Brevundimonas sp. TaxID=1871086 RepID=UPI002ABCE550|nr:glycosyltransferase [Brevundimonas sp.]MDZ4113416.1 glycosyltransferase [Brevundimonas sp.]